MRKFAIIVAGGSGSRMNTDVPKQFLLLDGKPILMHTIAKFGAISGLVIKLVLPENQIEHWADLCEQYGFDVTHDVVVGGTERFDSVKNGLLSITDEHGIVAVHDGVRPFVTTELIQILLSEAGKYGNAIPYTSPKESIREVIGNSNHAVERSNYRMIQTPQCFDLAALKKAYETEFRGSFTDDASVFEAAGGNIHLVEGEYANIKITTPDDLN